DRMLASPRVRSCPISSRYRLAKAHQIRRRAVRSGIRTAILCQPLDIPLPAGRALARAKSTPSAARKFGRRLEYPLVQDRRARARAIHPKIPTLAPRRVSLSVHGVSLSPENFSATQADKNANAPFRGGLHRGHAVPAAMQRTP